MVLEFDFTYIGDNDLLEYLLKFYAKDYLYNFSKTNEKIVFKISGNEEELTKFCDKLNYVGNSVFLQEFNVKACEDEIMQSDFKTDEFIKYDLLTYMNANAYLNDKLIDNEWDKFCDSFVLNENINKQNFKDLLNDSLKALLANENIIYENACAKYEVCLFKDNQEFDFLLACDIKAINKAFSCNNEIIKALASIEKPLIELKFNAIFKQNHKLLNDKARLKLADDLFLFALSNELFKQECNFLAFKILEKKEDEFEILNYEKYNLSLKGFKFVNKKAKELIFSKEDKNMARISYVLSLYDDKKMLFEIGQKEDDLILLEKKDNVLKLNLPNDFKTIKDDIKSDEIGQRLFENFTKEYEFYDFKFDVKNNFFSLFCMLGIILKFDDDFLKAGESLLNISDNSRLPKGVKIDFKFKENKEFDYVKTIKSTMSFMLAGVPKEDIAYGVVESFAYFLRDFYDEFKERNLSDGVVLSGFMFSHKSLLKNVLKHIKNTKITYVPLWI